MSHLETLKLFKSAQFTKELYRLSYMGRLERKIERFILRSIRDILIWILLAPFKLLGWLFSGGIAPKSINSRGYVVLTEFNELEHRHIAMQLLGRNLHKNEVVHHINGRKTDNAINNLCLMDSEKHEHFHAWLRWRKEKKGGYPSIAHQKRVLVEEYNGSLLERVEPPNPEPKKVKYNRALFIELKKERKRLAKNHGVPPYLIFHNKTLDDIAETMPTTEPSMLQIRGVGPKKMRKYGQSFIDIVKAFKGRKEESA